MAELKERRHSDLRDWVGESYSTRAVAAASALEEGTEAYRFGVLLARGRERQYERINDFYTSFHQRELYRRNQIEVDYEWLDAVVATIAAHADVVASRLKMTPDQLYSTTFAEVVDRYERCKDSIHSTESSEKKSLVERLNEAYSDEMEPEEKGLLDRAASQFGRRLNTEE